MRDAHDVRRRKAHVRDGVGTDFLRFRLHAVQRLLARLSHHLGVFLDLPTNETFEQREDVFPHMPGANRAAPHQSVCLYDALSRYRCCRRHDHLVTSLYGFLRCMNTFSRITDTSRMTKPTNRAKTPPFTAAGISAAINSLTICQPP